MSKREELREKRARDQRRNRIIWISAIVIVVLGVAALIIVPQVVESMTPVGNITTITPDIPSNPDRNNAGSTSAPVKVVEYGDYQCTACKSFEQNYYDNFIKTYVDTGKVYFTFKPFKVIGPESDITAEAAYCAADQNKYWPMHDILFANQGAENSGVFTNKRIKAMAESVGLDMTAFNSCYDSGKYKDQVTKTDQGEALGLGLNSTPSFTINGKVANFQTFDDLMAQIKTAAGG
jgi:protein-disulfide isomerase